MYCKNCGNQLDNSSKFCNKCGQQTQSEVVNNQVNVQPDLMAAPPQQQMPPPKQTVNQPNPIYQEFGNPNQNTNMNMNMNNGSFQNQPNNNTFNNNGNQSRGMMSSLPWILGVVALVFGFINEYIGALLGIATVVVSVKIKSKHSKKGKIMGIIAAIFFTLYIIGTAVFPALGITINDKNLNGAWNCTSINSLASGYYSNIMDFNNGEYIFELNGVRTTDKYKIEPSTYNRDVWESVKSSMSPYIEITDDKPETFMLKTNNNGSITIIKINTTSGEMLFVYTTDTYVCKRQ